MSKSLSTIKFFSVNSPEQDEQECKHFFENLDLILKNSKLICSRKRYSTILMPGMGCGNSIAGGEHFNLGVLLRLWNKTRWHEDSRYYICTSGSGLSGCNTTWWYNTETQTIESGTYMPFSKLCYVGLYYARQKDPYRKPAEVFLGAREKKSFAQWCKDTNVESNSIKSEPKQRKPRPLLSVYDLVNELKSRIR